MYGGYFYVKITQGETIIAGSIKGIFVRLQTKKVIRTTQITEKGCYIKSLNEAWLDTSSPFGEFMLTVFSRLAQFERRLLLERCKEGRAMAIKRGVPMGRPKKNTKP
jgi:DNA invertase Pin-like site-specific DNA recombinase